MISVLNKKECCGCNSCVQKCPKQCISMVADEEGFLYPSIKQELCIDCGLCQKVCPVINYKEEKQNVQAYAAYSKNDDIREKSSSGGLFTLFAKNILQENGVVFGAAFDQSFLVHHIAVESEEELDKLQGSKYLQSRIENTYQEVENFLQAGRRVLFTGTACQIAGLKMFLKRGYDFLYTIDILCHGVPSPAVWKKYLEYQEENYDSPVTQVFFRKKDFGWKKFALKLKFNNSKEYKQVFEKDLFMKMFLSNLCLRPSCHECKFKSLNRPSDITIGDSWGIEQYMPEMDDNRGTSVVLIHSGKGQELFEACELEMIYKEAETDVILSPTADSRKSVAMHSKRIEFFEKFNSGESIQELSHILRESFPKRTVKLCRSYIWKIKAKVRMLKRRFNR